MKKAQTSVFKKFFPSQGASQFVRSEPKRAYAVETTQVPEESYADLSEEEFQALVNSTMASNNPFEEDAYDCDRDYKRSD
jgi:hypothetical protein